METPRRDRCLQAQAFKPGQSSHPSGTQGLRILPGTPGLPLSSDTQPGAIGNAARMEASAFKELTD